MKLNNYQETYFSYCFVREGNVISFPNEGHSKEVLQNMGLGECLGRINRK